MIVFDLDNPNDYICWVTNYVDDKPQMVIGARHHGRYTSEDIVYFVFLGVQYFEGPLQWLGAEFSLGTKDEQLSLINSYSIWPNNIEIPNDMMLPQKNRFNEDWDSYNLYKVKSLQGAEIKIIAYQAFMSSKFPHP